MKFIDVNGKIHKLFAEDLSHQLSKEKNYEVEVRDLYKIKFQPILLPSDFESFAKGITPKDIEEDRWKERGFLQVVQ